MSKKPKDPIEELIDFIGSLSGKLNTPKKREVAKRLLEAFRDHKGTINAYEMGRKEDGIIFQISRELGTSYVYAYEVLRELIDIGIIAKTTTGYQLSPEFRKRLYRVYKIIGNLL